MIRRDKPATGIGHKTGGTGLAQQPFDPGCDLCVFGIADQSATEYEQGALRFGQTVPQILRPGVRHIGRTRRRDGWRCRRWCGERLQSIDRHLHMFAAGPLRFELDKGAVNERIGGVGGPRLFGPVANGFGGGALVFHLVQLALFRGGLVEAGRNHQHRYAVAIGLPHRRHDVCQPRPGDDIGHARLARRAGVTVGHEARPLFMAGEHVGDPRLFDPAIQFLIVHARNAKDHVNAAIPEHVGDLRAERTLHVRPSRSQQ